MSIKRCMVNGATVQRLRWSLRYQRCSCALSRSVLKVLKMLPKGSDVAMTTALGHLTTCSPRLQPA